MNLNIFESIFQKKAKKRKPEVRIRVETVDKLLRVPSGAEGGHMEQVRDKLLPLPR
jgi:hypothetical protein